MMMMKVNGDSISTKSNNLVAFHFARRLWLNFKLT